MRRIERRWSHSRDAGDEAALLRSKVRAGLLDPERLRLGAGLSDPAAVFAWGAAPARPSLSELITHTDGEVRVRTWLGVGQAVYQGHPEPAQEAMLCRLGLKLLAGVKAGRLDASDRRGEEGFFDGGSLRLSWWALYDTAPHELSRVFARRLEEWIPRIDDFHVGQVDPDPHAECAVRLFQLRLPRVAGTVEAPLVAWALQRGDPLGQWLVRQAAAPELAPVRRWGDSDFVSTADSLRAYGYAEGYAEALLGFRRQMQDAGHTVPRENLLALAPRFLSDSQCAELVALDDPETVRQRLRAWL